MAAAGMDGGRDQQEATQEGDQCWQGAVSQGSHKPLQHYDEHVIGSVRPRTSSTVAPSDKDGKSAGTSWLLPRHRTHAVDAGVSVEVAGKVPRACFRRRQAGVYPTE